MLFCAIFLVDASGILRGFSVIFYQVEAQEYQLID